MQLHHFLGSLLYKPLGSTRRANESQQRIDRQITLGLLLLPTTGTVPFLGIPILYRSCATNRGGRGSGGPGGMNGAAMQKSPSK